MSPEPLLSFACDALPDGGGAYDGEEGGTYDALAARGASDAGFRDEGGVLGDGGGRLVRWAARAAISVSEGRCFSEALLLNGLSAMRTSP
ncbi:MAG TPA: hypothetical protein VK550_16890 [Polyangiaceae bacterium]|nr:hypothetical protein [Polyangiaceae bacterium]